MKLLYPFQGELQSKGAWLGGAYRTYAPLASDSLIYKYDARFRSSVKKLVLSDSFVGMDLSEKWKPFNAKIVPYPGVLGLNLAKVMNMAMNEV